MAESDPGTLSLPARVDVGSAGQLYRTWAARAASLKIIDLSAVEHIDSAGVALLAALQAEARRRGASPPQLKSLPARFSKLCQAHRITFDQDPIRASGPEQGGT